MSDAAEAVQLTLRVRPTEGMDAGQVDAVARQLAGELRQVGVSSVGLGAGGPVPAGAKAGLAIELGALAVAVLPTLLPKVVEFLQSFVTRSQTIELEIPIGDHVVKLKAAGGARTVTELKNLVQSLMADAEASAGGARPGA